ncbi:Venom carboxylesterase-6 [Orchesella cincta]|uniref:Carboxylic ester hydrolase n=1 Tax=Orchesella cincta TaxID=48709 RepID=A0A1D2MEY8_ORCCI|nr:Venom carboxylesterase-6 [Orchesella cincta]
MFKSTMWSAVVNKSTMGWCFRMFFALSFALFASTYASGNGSKQSIVVSTQQGKLEGLISKSRNGNAYYAFKGVPYADYPGRFQVATKFAKWDGIRSAKELGSYCAQIDLLDTSGAFYGKEQCLFLNIYTPTTKKDANLPTIFWIHGGAFAAGSGDDFEGKYFVDEGVIVVSINYRLGPLGFLSFGDDEVPGNIGLKDQLLALKWVKKNINSFGGDPNKVTLAGHSAGGASVHFQILSPQSKDLFRAAISQSGTATAFWATQTNPRDNAIKLASALNCPLPETRSSSTKDTVACLKSKSDMELVAAQVKLKEWYVYPIVLFAPVIEPEDQTVFWWNHQKLFCEREILTRDSISSEIRESYFDRFEIDEFTWQSFRDLFTDRYWLEPLETSIRLQSQHSRVFPYVFRFFGDHSLVHKIYGVSGNHGVGHGDDLQYLYVRTSVVILDIMLCVHTMIA